MCQLGSGGKELTTGIGLLGPAWVLPLLCWCACGCHYLSQPQLSHQSSGLLIPVLSPLGHAQG